ncbi:hypothetical protein Bca4012_099764 [Brassica carinata]
MAVWLSSFCDSMSATSSRMVGSLPSGQDVDLKRQCVICLSFGDGDLFLLCSSMCMSCQWCDQKDICELFLGESYHKERIIGQTNFYRVMTLGFTVASPSAASPSAASPSAASGLFRLGEASGKLCLLKFLKTGMQGFSERNFIVNHS